MDYNQLPGYPDIGKPTRYKDWIVKLTDEIHKIKGTTNHYDPVPISLTDVVKMSGNQILELEVPKESFKLDEETGLYKCSKLKHGLKSIDLLIEVYNSNRQTASHSISILNEDEIDIYTIYNISCIVVINPIHKS